MLQRSPALISEYDIDDDNDEEGEEDEDEDEDEDDDEFSYYGSIEDGEKLLSKWNEIFSSDLENFFDESLTMSKTENDVFDFSDKEKELLFTTSDDFDEDDDGYITIKFIKKMNLQSKCNKRKDS